MKGKDIKIGELYSANISGKKQTVRITQVSQYGGFIGVNPATGREIRVRTGGRLTPLSGK